MRINQPIVDFRDLISSVRGEGLERLTSFLGDRLKLSPVWTGRGADQGKDLTFTEIHTGPLCSHIIRWVVSCKDKATSGDAVQEKDLPSIGDKVKQHKAQGFLLVTTTTVGVAAKALLDGHDVNNGGDIHTRVWDVSDLSKMLLQPENHDLLKQFLPESYKRLHRLDTIDVALAALKVKLPNDVYLQVATLIEGDVDGKKPAIQLKGSEVWPYDAGSSSAIDNITRYLLIDHQVDRSVEATENIEYDAFVNLMERLYQFDRHQTFEYVSAVICTHRDPDIAFNAFQFLTDKYDVSDKEEVQLASHLDTESLLLWYGSFVEEFVRDEIVKNTWQYRIGASFNDLPGLTALEQVNYVNVTRLWIQGENDFIVFHGRLEVDVTLSHDADQPMSSEEVKGDFLGRFDADGLRLDTVAVFTHHLADLDARFRSS